VALTWGDTRHTGLVHCAVRRPFPLLAWAAVPVLFTAAVLGLTSVGQLLLGAPGDTVLTSAHLGASAGLTAMVAYSIEWPPSWRWVRWPYPIAVFVAGILVHGLMVPTIVALAAGVPSAAIMIRIACQHRSIGNRRRETLVSG
jgi:hypothetical protein